MKPTELPPHLWPPCRRVMLRHAAALAREMLDYAEDTGLRVNRATLESIEHRALEELAAGADTIEKAAADLRLMPSEIVASSQERSKFSAQLRQMFDRIRAAAARHNTRPLVEIAWLSLEERVVALMEAAPPTPLLSACARRVRS